MFMRFLGLPEDEWKCWMCSGRSDRPSNSAERKGQAPTQSAVVAEVVNVEGDLSQYRAQRSQVSSPITFDKIPELRSWGDQEDEVSDVDEDKQRDEGYIEQMNRCRLKLNSTVRKQRAEMRRQASNAAALGHETSDVSGTISRSISFSMRGMSQPMTPTIRADTLRRMPMGPVVTQSGRCIHGDAVSAKRTGGNSTEDLQGNSAAGDSGEDSDGDGGSDLEHHGKKNSSMHVDDLYEKSAGRIETIKQIMYDQGIVPPSRARDLYATDGFAGKEHARELNKITAAWSGEVERYQDVMRAKFKHLGARDADAEAFGNTANPATAVRDAVGRYHVLCEELGEYYAMPGDTNGDLTSHQRDQLHKFVQRLGGTPRTRV